MCVSIYISKCNMQHLNNGFNRFKVSDFYHGKMLIIQKMWRKSLNHSNIITKHWVACVPIYCNKCKMQLMNNGFNIFKVNGLTQVHMLIIEKMWKKSIIHSNINVVGSRIISCVLINHDKCKMELMSNDFNMLKVDGSTYVPCWCWKYVKKIINPL